MSFEVCFISGIILSDLLNLLIVVVILSKGDSINYMDIIIVSLSTSDILQATVGYTVEIYSIYTSKSHLSFSTEKSSKLNITASTTTGKSPLSLTTTTTTTIIATHSQPAECITAGFTITFFALTSIFHLTGLSIERRFILQYPLRARMWLRRKLVALYVILPSWSLGLFWSLFPLLGWSSYVRLKNTDNGCIINIQGRDPNHLTYSYNLLFWCFVLPVSVMAYCCNDIRTVIQRTHRQGVVLLGVNQHTMAARRKADAKVTSMTMVMILTFLCSWTPYAGCLFVITASVEVPSSLLSTAAIFAKMSTLYNPVVYFIFMKDFRKKLRKMCGMKPTNTVTPQTTTVTVVGRSVTSRW